VGAVLALEHLELSVHVVVVPDGALQGRIAHTFACAVVVTDSGTVKTFIVRTRALNQRVPEELAVVLVPAILELVGTNRIMSSVFVVYIRVIVAVASGLVALRDLLTYTRSLLAFG
jgi:hypothetical protein